VAGHFDANDLKRRFLRDRFAAFAGIELLEVAPGRAVVAMTVAEHHLNAVDVAHGGALFTLADFAFAVASNSHGPQALAIQASVHFVRAAVSGERLVAEAREISCGARLATYLVDVRCGEELVATMQAMAYRRTEPKS
jgi:acyl-CoA thioesterase